MHEIDPSHLIFKHVVGTGIGAIVAGATLSTIAYYRGARGHNLANAALGAVIVATLGFAGNGDVVYDETVGRFSSSTRHNNRDIGRN